MARFDVIKTKSDALVVDCQSEFLDYLQTRFVIPLLPPDLEPKIAERLNPVFLIEGQNYVLYPQFSASIAVRELGTPVASLANQHSQIIEALDMLVSGF